MRQMPSFLLEPPKNNWEEHPPFSRNVFFRFAQEIFVLVLSIASSIIIARWLGPGGKGIVNTLSTFSGFVALVASLGIPTAAIYYAAGRKYSYEEIMSNTVAFLLLFPLPLAFLLLSLISPLYNTILKGVPPLLIGVSFLLIPLNIVSTLLSSLLTARQRFGALFVQTVSGSFFTLFLLSIFLIILRLKVTGAMLAYWLAIPFNIFLLFHYLSDTITIRVFKPNFRKEILKNLLSYGLKIFLANILWMTSLRLDVFIVNYFLNPSAVGLYMTGVSYTELLRMVPTSLSGPLFPRVSASSMGEAERISSLVTRLLSILLPLLALAFYFLAPLIIPFFFGKAFLPSVKVVGYLLPGIIAWSYASQISSYVVGRGHPEVQVYAGVAALLVTLLLDFSLIPRMGIIGASLASSCAYSASFLVSYHFFRRLSGLSFWETFIPTSGDVSFLWKRLKSFIILFISTKN